MTYTFRKNVLLLVVLLLCFSLCGCGDLTSLDSVIPSPQSSGMKGSSGSKDSSGKKDSSDSKDSSGKKDSSSSDSSAKEEKGSRDNTAKVLKPKSDGTEEYSCDSATVDASHKDEGYIMVNYTGSNEKVKLQVTGPDKVTQTYNLHGGYEVFPLTAGDGSYTVGIFESVSTKDNKYSTALSKEISVKIKNEFGPYLYPNQYVNFSSKSLPVAKAEELAYSANEDLDVVTNVYNYIIDHFSYDYDKAATVASGYLPVVDEIYKINTGICFDYAAVMATMLRSQRIPTRLEVGYKGEEYHAWVSIYIENMGWVNGIIQFDGTTWRLMDPTFASTSKSPKKFITDDDGYMTKYVY